MYPLCTGPPPSRSQLLSPRRVLCSGLVPVGPVYSGVLTPGMPLRLVPAGVACTANQFEVHHEAQERAGCSAVTGFTLVRPCPLAVQHCPRGTMFWVYLCIPSSLHPICFRPSGVTALPTSFCPGLARVVEKAAGEKGKVSAFFLLSNGVAKQLANSGRETTAHHTHTITRSGRPHRLPPSLCPRSSCPLWWSYALGIPSSAFPSHRRCRGRGRMVPTRPLRRPSRRSRGCSSSCRF